MMLKFMVALFAVAAIHQAALCQEKKKVKAPISEKSSMSSKKEDAEFYYRDADTKKSNSTEAVKSIQKGLKLAIDNNDVKSESRAYYTLGNVFFFHGQFDLALENFQLAQSKSFVQYFPNDEMELLENMALCQEKLIRYSEALAIRKSLFAKISKQNKPSLLLLQAKKIAYAKWKLGNADEAIQDYFFILNSTLYPLTAQDKIECNNRIADIYSERGVNNKAKTFYNKALVLSKQDDTKNADYESTDKLSKIYTEERNYDQAIKLRSEAQGRSVPAAPSAEMDRNQVKLAEIYIQQDNAEAAIPLLEESVSKSRKTGDNQNRKDALQNLATAYAQINQYDQALKFYKKYTALHDSLLKVEESKLGDSIREFKKLSAQNNQVAIFKKNLELNQQIIISLQKQNKLDEANLKKQTLLIYSLTLGLVFLVIIIYIIHRSNKLKRKTNQILVLKSLRGQMNPHFIFNSLNAVNHFILQNKELEANKFIADFAKLMRAVMENSQEDFITLDQEAEIVKLYLKLEHQRFEDKFDYTFDLQLVGEPEALLIPPMLIQPYIENAIWHGLRYREGKGYLKVNVMETHDKIIISIEDNGIGRKKSQELKTKNQKSYQSTGMKNTLSRVEIMNEIFDSEMKVSVHDLHPDYGTRVIIELALKYK